MSARNLPLMLIFLALGFALGCLFTSPESRHVPKGGDSAALEAIASRLEHIEAALDRERGGVALRSHPSAAGLAEPPDVAAPGAPERVPVEPEARPEAAEAARSSVAEEIAALREAVESLRQALAERGMTARFPALEMLRSAAQADMLELESLHARAHGGPALHDAMRESVRWMSQDEVLARFGRPSRIHAENGNWTYILQRQDEGKNRKVIFVFVENYVSDIVCYGEP